MNFFLSSSKKGASQTFMIIVAAIIAILFLLIFTPALAKVSQIINKDVYECQGEYVEYEDFCSVIYEKGNKDGKICCITKNEEAYKKNTDYLQKGDSERHSVGPYSHKVQLDDFDADPDGQATITISSDPITVSMHYNVPQTITIPGEGTYRFKLVPKVIEGKVVAVKIEFEKTDVVVSADANGNTATGTGIYVMYAITDRDFVGPPVFKNLEGSQLPDIEQSDALHISFTINNPTKYCVAYVSGKKLETDKSYTLLSNSMGYLRIAGLSEDDCEMLNLPSFTLDDVPDYNFFKIDVIAFKEKNECKPDAANPANNPPKSLIPDLCWEKSFAVYTKNKNAATSSDGRTAARIYYELNGGQQTLASTPTVNGLTTSGKIKLTGKIINPTNGCVAYLQGKETPNGPLISLGNEYIINGESTDDCAKDLALPEYNPSDYPQYAQIIFSVAAYKETADCGITSGLNRLNPICWASAPTVIFPITAPAVNTAANTATATDECSRPCSSTNTADRGCLCNNVCLVADATQVCYNNQYLTNTGTLSQTTCPLNHIIFGQNCLCNGEELEPGGDDICVNLGTTENPIFATLDCNTLSYRLYAQTSYLCTDYTTVFNSYGLDLTKQLCNLDACLYGSSEGGSCLYFDADNSCRFVSKDKNLNLYPYVLTIPSKYAGLECRKKDKVEYKCEEYCFMESWSFECQEQLEKDYCNDDPCNYGGAEGCEIGTYGGCQTKRQCEQYAIIFDSPCYCGTELLEPAGEEICVNKNGEVQKHDCTPSTQASEQTGYDCQVYCRRESNDGICNTQLEKDLCSTDACLYGSSEGGSCRLDGTSCVPIAK